MIDEYDVTITEANLHPSQVTGMPVVALVFLPHTLCFFDDILVSRLYAHLSNNHPGMGWKRVGLRSILSMIETDEPFTDKELRSMIGRLIRVVIEPVEFRDRVRLRVVGFKCYSGDTKDVSYSDNEYVFMMRELM